MRRTLFLAASAALAAAKKPLMPKCEDQADDIGASICQAMLNVGFYSCEGLLSHVRRASCRSVQPVVRLLPYLYAYSISFLLHAYDAIRSFISTNETTYEETNSYGRDSHSTTVLRAQQSTYIVYTF